VNGTSEQCRSIRTSTRPTTAAAIIIIIIIIIKDKIVLVLIGALGAIKKGLDSVAARSHFGRRVIGDQTGEHCTRHS